MKCKGHMSELGIKNKSESLAIFLAFICNFTTAKISFTSIIVINYSYPYVGCLGHLPHAKIYKNFILEITMNTLTTLKYRKIPSSSIQSKATKNR